MMDGAEFKRHVFLANKELRLKEAFEGKYFNLCPINNLLRMCNTRGEMSLIMDSDEYDKLSSVHVVNFSGMGDDLVTEIKNCCESVCYMINQTYEKKPATLGFWARFMQKVFE